MVSFPTCEYENSVPNSSGSWVRNRSDIPTKQPSHYREEGEKQTKHGHPTPPLTR